MCYECWKEFKGWCKAFTRTEVLLAIIEAILLIIFVAFLIFLIMHIIVCASWLSKGGQQNPSTHDVPTDETINEPTDENGEYRSTEDVQEHTTLDPSVQCTWEPSKKTDAETHYFEGGQTTKKIRPIFALKDRPSKTTQRILLKDQSTVKSVEKGADLYAEAALDSFAFDEQSDGEEADNEYKSALLALVKLHPPNDVTFGCVVAVISEHWTLTAASCVEAVEEIDSLDNFLLMERYGEARRGRTHTIADVQLHPQYQGANRSYDVAALRSEDSLRPAATPLALPTLLDYFLVTVGERFSILGFGSFRTIDPSSAERTVRAVDVYTLPAASCRAGDSDADQWAPRHLSRGREDAHGAGGCGASALCAGVRYARGRACTYCGGTPLVRSGVLMGVMAAARACAVACEPALFVSVALVKDWLDMILSPDH